MPRVRIIPNTTYHPGHIGNLISQVAPGPMALQPDGSVIVKMTDGQLEDFYRRGGSAHKVEILSDADPTIAVAGTGQAAERTGQTQTEFTATAGERVRPVRSLSDAERYVEGCRRRGMTDSQVIAELVKAGWKESQAIDLVANGEDQGPTAA